MGAVRARNISLMNFHTGIKRLASFFFNANLFPDQNKPYKPDETFLFEFCLQLLAM